MKLFVYGTLRPGSTAFEKYLQQYCLNSQDAYIYGSLYQMKDRTFPALLAGNRMIRGVLFELCDDFDWKNLDLYEEYIAENHVDNLYNRSLSKVFTRNDEEVDAYVYWYNLTRTQAKEELGHLIESNDFLKQ